MSNKYIVMGIATFVIGGAMGRYVFPVSTSPEVTLINETQLAQEQTESRGKYAETNVESDNINRMQSVSLSTLPTTDRRKLLNELRRRIDNSQVQDMDSLFDVYEIARQLSEPELTEVISELLSQTDRDTTQLSLLIDQLVKLDPIHTLQLVLSQAAEPVKGELVNSVIQQWGKLEPQKALDFYMANRGEQGFGRLDTYALDGVFQHLAKSNDVASWVDTIHQFTHKGDAIEFENERLTVVSQLASYIDNPEQLAQLYVQLKSSADSDEQINETLLVELVNKAPNALMQMIDSGDLGELERSNYSALTFRLMDGDGKKTQLKERADWLISKVESRYKDRFVQDISSSWGRQSPYEAFHWLEQQEGLSADVKGFFIGSMAYDNPEFAMEKVSTLASEAMQSEVSYQIYYNLQFRNKQQATDFLNDSPIKESIEKHIAEENQRRKEVVEEMREAGEFIPPELLQSIE